MNSAVGDSDENTPLLARSDSSPVRNDRTDGQQNGAPVTSSASFATTSKPYSFKRWPSLLALLVLCLFILIILVFAFVAPQIVQEYAEKALVLNPTGLSVESISDKGVYARVQGTMVLDGSRVENKPVRDLGRFGTWIVREIDTKETTVRVTLPEYGDVLLGTATIPPIKIRVRDGFYTFLDFVVLVQPAVTDGIRRVADDWLSGKLGELRIQGDARVSFTSGIFSFGTHNIMHSIIFDDNDVPKLPKYNISNVDLRQEILPDGRKGLRAKAAIYVENDYSLGFNIPPLGFGILAPNCKQSQAPIMIADARTEEIHVKPKVDVQIGVTGFIRRLPPDFLTSCPGSAQSPLDSLIGDYVHGTNATLFIRGSDSPSLRTPEWLSDFISSVTVPVPLPGRKLGHLIKKFSLRDVHFDLPDMLAEPGTPEAQPKISANIQALIGLPQELKFPIEVHRVRANATAYYKGEEMGVLDLREWRPATSQRPPGNSSDLEVESQIKNAPLTITDDEVFSNVIGQLLTSKEPVNLMVKADVDIDLETALGNFVVRKIPAKGDIPVKPISGHNFTSLKPKVGDIRVATSDTDSLTVTAKVNFSNPTTYGATVPFVDVKILVNDTVVGNARAENVIVSPGYNENVQLQATYSPSISGNTSKAVGKEFISQWLSGFNTSISLRTHEGTIPAQPSLGKALQRFGIDIPTPHLTIPKDPNNGDDNDPDDDEDSRSPHFIKRATMHLFSSTAVFTLVSPLGFTTLYVPFVDAMAYYEGEEVAEIVSTNDEIEVPPGQSDTPKLPVDWSLDSVGYDAIKNALGGTLTLAARANITVRIGKFVQDLWYIGRGVHTTVRI